MNEIRVVSPEGEHGTANEVNLPDLIKQGFRLETQDETDKALLKKEYGQGFGNELQAGVEGALSGATFGLSRFINPEEQALRKEFNPTASTVGEIAGIGGSLFIPGAPAARLAGATTKPGLGATEALGGGAVSKIVGSTLAGAVENAAYGAGQVLDEKALGDPTLTAQKAFTQIGLASLIGGGIGGSIKGLGVAGGKLLSKNIAPEAEAILGAEVPSIHPQDKESAVMNLISGVKDGDYQAFNDQFENVIKNAKVTQLTPDEALNIRKSHDFSFDTTPDKELLRTAARGADLRDPSILVNMDGELFALDGQHRLNQAIQSNQPANVAIIDGSFLKDFGLDKKLSSEKKLFGKLEPTKEQKDIAKALSTDDVNIRPKDVEYYQTRAQEKVLDPITGKEVNAMEAAPPLIRSESTPPTQKTLQDHIVDSRSEIQDAVSDLNKNAADLLDNADFTIETQKLANVFDENINRLKSGKIIGETEKKAIRKLEFYRDQLTPVYDAEGNILREAPGDFTAQEAKDLIRKLDDDLDVIYAGKFQKGKMTLPERELFNIRTSLRDSLSDKMTQAGFPEYKEMLAEMHRKLKVIDAYDRNFSANNSYAQRILGSLQREVEDIQGTVKMTPRAKSSQADWLNTVKELGYETGKDFSTMYKDRYIWAKFHPEGATNLEKGSPFSQVLKGVAKLARNPTEIPGKILGEAVDAAQGKSEILNHLKKKAAMDALQGKSSNLNAANSILDKIQNLAGSKLLNNPLLENAARTGRIGLQNFLTNEVMNHDSIDQADQKLDALMGLEKAQKKADQNIKKAVKGVFSNEPIQASKDKEFHLKDAEDVSKHVEELRSQTNELANNPELLMDRLDQANVGMDHAPNITASLNMTAVRALQFLSQQMQGMGQDGKLPFDPKYVPSKDQVFSLTKTLEYIHNPWKVLEDVASGRMSKEGKDVLTNVMPELYAEMKADLMNEISIQQSKGKSIPMAKKLGMSYFLDTPLDSYMTPQAIASNQAIFATPTATPNQPNPTATNAKNLNMAQNMMTPLQKVASRG